MNFSEFSEKEINPNKFKKNLEEAFIEQHKDNGNIQDQKFEYYRAKILNSRKIRESLEKLRRDYCYLNEKELKVKSINNVVDYYMHNLNIKHRGNSKSKLLVLDCFELENLTTKRIQENPSNIITNSIKLKNNTKNPKDRIDRIIKKLRDRAQFNRIKLENETIINQNQKSRRRFNLDQTMIIPSKYPQFDKLMKECSIQEKLNREIERK